MITCPYCAFGNREGIFFCEDCGHPLKGGIFETLPTKKFMTTVHEYLPNTATWGTAHFHEGGVVVLHVNDVENHITLNPSNETLFGRLDPSSPQKPDVDLTPFGAVEKGISRIHAAIVRTEDNTLTLVDKGSMNGTLLNGQRLTPNQPRILRDGDEIRFARLVTHIYFK